MYTRAASFLRWWILWQLVLLIYFLINSLAPHPPLHPQPIIKIDTLIIITQGKSSLSMRQHR